MKSILDQTFAYTPALKTDIAKTFRRVQDERRSAEFDPWFDASAFVDRQNVRPILRSKTA